MLELILECMLTLICLSTMFFLGELYGYIKGFEREYKDLKQIRDKLSEEQREIDSDEREGE